MFISRLLDIGQQLAYLIAVGGGDLSGSLVQQVCPFRVHPLSSPKNMLIAIVCYNIIM